MKILVVLGTRPEIIRLSLVIERLDPLCELVLVHTGQNFDPALSDVFFDELGVRDPDRNLEIAGGGFGARVGRILEATEELIGELAPDRMLVLGDTDSAMSAYVAKRRGVPVLHMEAGNRCFDDRVPEEVNRRIIDQASDLLMPYTERSRENLLREGFDAERVLVIGNPINEVMIRHAERIDESPVLSQLGLEEGGYLLLTLHRQETVDFPERLAPLVDEIVEAAGAIGLPVIFSVHPRTRERLDGAAPEVLRLCEPFGYFDFLSLARSARCVLTDSGTVQEECCIMGVPAVTVRDSTERPETVECGSNLLSGVGRGGVGPALELACTPGRTWTPPPEYLETDVSSTVAAAALGPLPEP